MMCKKRLAHGGCSVIDRFPWDNPHGKTAGAIRLAGGRREEKYKEKRKPETKPGRCCLEGKGRRQISRKEDNKKGRRSTREWSVSEA